MSPDERTRFLQSPRQPRRIPGYEILRTIGRGATGEVVLARQLALGRDVAIKFVDMSQAADPHEQVARFRREAELMAKISHPNIVTIYDFGTVDGQPYLVMEYVEGGDLRREMIPQQPMPVDRILALLRPIIRALDCLHRQEILHRDLKPENVLMHHEDPVLARGRCLRDADRPEAARGLPAPVPAESRAGPGGRRGRDAGARRGP
jgi:serine/threonine protein kinase